MPQLIYQLIYETSKMYLGWGGVEMAAGTVRGYDRLEARGLALNPWFNYLLNLQTKLPTNSLADFDANLWVILPTDRPTGMIEF